LERFYVENPMDFWENLLFMNDIDDDFDVEKCRETCMICKVSMSPSLIESGWCIFCICKEKNEKLKLVKQELKRLLELLND